MVKLVGLLLWCIQQKIVKENFVMRFHFNLFDKLLSKDMKPRLNPLILKIYDKENKIFDKRSNKP